MPRLGNEVTTVIKTGQRARAHCARWSRDHVNRFELMDDAYLRERASDVKDLGRRLLAYLQEERQQTLADPDNTILVSEELTPADARRGAGREAGGPGVGTGFRRTPTSRSLPGPWAFRR